MVIHPAWFAIGVGGIVSAVAVLTPVAALCFWMAFGAVAFLIRQRREMLVHIVFGLGWSLPACFVARPAPPLPPRTFGAGPVTVCGVADSVMRRTASGWAVELTELRVAGVPTAGRLRFTASDGGALPSSGQSVCAEARVSTVWPRFNPGSRSFQQVWLDRGIRFRAHASRVRLGLSSAGLLAGWRSRYRERAVTVSPTVAPLLEAMVLGDAAALERTVRQRFQRTGTSHLLAISGLHVGLIACSAFAIVRWMVAWGAIAWVRRFPADAPAAVAAVLTAGLYVVLAGAPASAQRAAWMVASVALGRVLQRSPDGLSALSIAMAVMLCGAPQQILDPSFQLSFSAVAALLFGHSIGARWLRDRTERWPIRWAARVAAGLGGALWTSVLCTLGTLPAALFHFDSVAPLGVVLNVVAIPLAAWGLVVPGILMLVSELAFPGFGGFDPFFGQWLETGAGWLVSLVEWADGPAMRADGVRQCLAALGLVAGLVCALRWCDRRRWRFRVAITAVVCSWLLWPTGPSGPDSDELRLTFLDVGHGDCVIIQRDDGHALLVDGGGDPTGRYDPGESVVVPALKALGVTQLDAVIVSHAHPDHYRGLDAVVREFPVDELWFNGQRPSHDPAWGRLTRRLTRLGTARVRVVSGPTETVLYWRDVRLTRLGPLARGGYRRAWSANDNSLVWRVDYGGFSALLTGDIERAAERALIPRLSPVDVLKVPHHGSRTSSTPSFVGAVRPRLAVAQAQDGGRFGLPHPQIEARYRAHGIRFWVTGRCGAVQVRTRGRGFDFYAFGPQLLIEQLCPRGDPPIVWGER